MPIFNVRTPDGSLMKINGPEDATDDELIQIASENYTPPQTFGERVKRAAKRGLEEVPESAAGIGLGLQSALGFKEAAGKHAEAVRKEQEAQAQQPQGLSFEELKKIYEEKGLAEALKNAPAYMVEQVLQSAPSMAVPLAAGAGAAAVSGPLAPIVGPAAGIATYGLQQFGSFMNRQAQEGATGETLAPGKAATAAAVTAPIGYFADRLTLGLGKIPEKVLGKEVAEELARRVGGSIAGRAATGATIGVVAEAPTEVLEQIAERWQAGLPLNDEKAQKEYWEAAVGAASVGGVGGAGARVLAGAPEEKKLIEGLDQTPPETAPETPTEPVEPTPSGPATLALEAPPEKLLLEGPVREPELDIERQARAATMPGFGGAQTTNTDLLNIVKERKIAEAKQQLKDMEAEVKRIRIPQSPDPIMDKLRQDRELKALGYVEKTNAATQAIQEAETLTPEQLTPEDIALAEAQQPLQGESTEAKADLASKKAIAEQKQLQQANAKQWSAPASLTNKEDIADLVAKRVETQKKLDDALAVKGNLFNLLRGKLSQKYGGFGLNDLSMDESKAKQLFNKEGKGQSLEDMVADGSLDEFLKTPHSSPKFDAQSAVQEIADKLASGDYHTTIATANIEAAKREKDELNKQIEDIRSMPEANLELRVAAEEQAGVEPVAIADLEKVLKQAGGAPEIIADDLARQMADQPEAVYQAAYRKALESEIKAQTGDREVLRAGAKGSKPTVATPEQVRVQSELKGKTFLQAAKWAVDNAPNSFSRYVADKVYKRLADMQARGVKFEFKIADGNRRNSDLDDAKGVTDFIWTKEPAGTRITIELNGNPVLNNQAGFPSGMEYGTVLHELLHAATRGNIKFLRDTDPLVLELRKLYDTVARDFMAREKAGQMTDFMKRFRQGGNNAFLNADEMLSWAMTDKEMQAHLNEIKVGEKTVFSKIVSLVRELFMMPKHFETALDRLVRTTDSILDSSLDTLENGMVKQGFVFGQKESVKPRMTEQQSLFSKKAQELFKQGEKPTTEKETLAYGFNKKKPAPTPTSEGAKIKALMKDVMGRFTEAEAEKTAAEKVTAKYKDLTKDPTETAKQARATFQRFSDYVQTKAFSSDAGLNNKLQRGIQEMSIGQQEKIGLMLDLSLSQTVHRDAIASVALEKGGLDYDEKLHKWIAVEDKNNLLALSKKVDEIAKHLGYTKDAAMRVAHTALEAKRLNSLVKQNSKVEAEIATLQEKAQAELENGDADKAKALNEKIERLQKDVIKIHMSPEQRAVGMQFFDMIPGMSDVVSIWNGMRENTSKIMVKSGLWSKEDADYLLSNADYVPFNRVMDEAEELSPRDTISRIRGLQVKAKEPHIKGSLLDVNDIFDNMVKWQQHAISRAVSNRSAVALAMSAKKHGSAEHLNGPSKEPNVVRVFMGGKPQYLKMSDPLYMDAFKGLESVVLPMMGPFSMVANIVRQSIVLNPAFSLAQLSQDSFAAMFSSGLKPRYALTIPARAVKEFVDTIRGVSKTHQILKNVGAAGVRDFTASMVRNDAETYAGFRSQPGLWNKVKHALGTVAMASDNAIRQATYDATIAQYGNTVEAQSIALEKAFEVFNVRRKGSSKTLALAGQVIPFFSAYLAVQNVAYKTLSGTGISPSERKDALATLAATTASVMTLSLLYAMMAGDDEGYLDKPVNVRDRALVMPGTNGSVMIPLRSDIYSMPKILTEHLYLLMTDKGSEDGAKLRTSLSAALANSIFSPTVVPQAAKPFLEAYINYDFFQQRPLIGSYQKGLEVERQFTDSTSELGKLFGQTGLISPIAADHIMRGIFGSIGGAAMLLSNQLIQSDPSVPRPDISMKDALAALPSVGGFVGRDYENALRKDFYTLKEEVDRAVNTMNDLKTRSPQQIPEFIAQEENVARLGLQKPVNAIAGNLSKLRKSMTQIANSPDMSGEEKQALIKQLRESEKAMLKGVDVKALREMAKI